MGSGGSQTTGLGSGGSQATGLGAAGAGGSNFLPSTGSSTATASAKAEAQSGFGGGDANAAAQAIAQSGSSQDVADAFSQAYSQGAALVLGCLLCFVEFVPWPVLCAIHASCLLCNQAVTVLSCCLCLAETFCGMHVSQHLYLVCMKFPVASKPL